ncbi:MAG TPA: hypothetical protein PKY81_13745 [bacterium]|nr:hypothetical protein [bacterium]
MSKSLDIKNHGLFRNIGGMGNYTGVLHPYLMYLSNIIFPDIIFAGRILNLFSVIIISILLIIILKSDIPNNLILLLIILFSLNPFNFGFHRVAWPHSLLPLFSISGILFFHGYLKTKKTLYLAAALIIAGLGAQLHPVMTLQVGFYIIFILIYQRQLAKQIISSKTFIFLAICFLIGSFSVVYFNINAVQRLFGIHLTNIIEIGFFKVINILIIRFAQYSKIFINNFTGYPSLEYFSGILYSNIALKILLYSYSVLLLFSAIHNCLSKNNLLKNIFGFHSIFLFFAIPFFLEFGGFNMHKLHPGEERIFLITTPIIFINYILFADNLKTYSKKIFYSFSAAIICINIINISYNYFYNFKTTGGTGDQCYFINEKDAKLHAAEYISKNYSDSNTIIFVQDYWLYWPLKIYFQNKSYEIFYAPKCKIPRHGYPEINEFSEIYKKYPNKNILFAVWSDLNNKELSDFLSNNKKLKSIQKKNGAETIYIYSCNNSNVI